MCTGIMLRAQNNDIVRARTLEWSAFDLDSKLIIVPRNYQTDDQIESSIQTDGWQGKYGYVAVNFRDLKDFCFDGINEKGFSVGIFYHPDTACYEPMKKSTQKHTVSISQVISFVLSQCADVKEAKALLSETYVAPIFNEDFHQVPPAHYIFCDQSGECFVMEFIKGEMIITDNPLGVITNSPSFDWHITNLRNYLKLSQQPADSIELAGITFKPLSAGTGFLGIPGDYTSPSRFVRAVAFSQTARPTSNGMDTVQESFRILDSFNVGIGGGEGADININRAAKSTTVWTTAADVTNLKFYYHTQYNRRTRMIDLKKVNFDHNKIIMRPLDQKYDDDFEEITI